VLEQGAHQVAHERETVGRGAAEFAMINAMSHGSIPMTV